MKKGISKKEEGFASKSLYSSFYNLVQYIHTNVQNVNQSKLFAGLIIITLNISSKFVTIKLSKTVESYLKHTFSRDVLVFAIAWMGTRDIYIALIIVLLFILFMDFLFNEDSRFCCLPEQFTDYHVNLLDDSTKPVPPEEIQRAKDILERAKKQEKGTDISSVDLTGSNEPTPMNNGMPNYVHATA